MMYKNICGYNLNLIKAALCIGCYDIFGTIALIVLEIEFFSESMKQQLLLINFMWFSALIGINFVHPVFFVLFLFLYLQCKHSK